MTSFNENPLRALFAWQQSIIGSVSALEKKCVGPLVSQHFHYILVKYFIQKLFFSQKFPLIQNSFVAIHNKMFRAGAKTLVGPGNLKHILASTCIDTEEHDKPLLLEETLFNTQSDFT